LIIFDTSERGLADLPVLWTQDKDLYIILELSGLHYSPVQLIRKADGERMPLLLDQDTARRALEKSDYYYSSSQCLTNGTTTVTTMEDCCVVARV
jgi:hypothetical protein